MIILCVSEEEILNRIQHALSKHSHQILPASNGYAAMRLMAPERDIHLIITNVTLPDMTGPLLVTRVREIYPEISVLYLSSFSRQRLQEQGIRIPDASFIQTPFSEELLREKVEMLLI